MNNIADEVFTKIDDNINLEVNNISATCITSKENNFSLDKDGNLIVNSITAKNNSSFSLTFDDIYPVGSVYLSVSNINPNTYFGGTWERIANGRTLVGVDETDSDFITPKKTGGEKKHKLTVNELPKHQPNALLNTGDSSLTGSAINWQVVSNGRFYSGDMFKTIGGDLAHNNLQPFLTCYIWQRIS